jgi:hypothetical protein
MPIDVQMPDGTIISGVPDNINQSDLLARYQAYKPVTSTADASGAVPDELGRYDVAKQPTGGVRKPEDVSALERNIAAGKRGFESLSDVAGGLGLAGTALTGTPEETASKMREIKREQAKPQETPGLTASDIERIYKEKGLLSAAGQVPSYISEQILASAPQMAIPLAAGAAATPFLSPVGGALVGMGTYGVQQFGNFLTRQAQEKNDPKELEILKAAGTAAVTAPLGYFADKFTAGLGGLGTKKAGAEILKELSARQVAAQVGKKAAGGAAAGVIAEAPLEVLEQAAERWQAGLSLTGDDAENEYKEAFFGAAAAGAGIGGASRGIQAYQKPVKPGMPPEVTPTTEPAPPEEITTPATPPMTAPVSESQDTQQMMNEIRGVPPVSPPPSVAPPVTPDVTPQVTPVEPVGNVWESIQNRDRSTPASVAQMAKIANEPDYTRVSMSRDYGTGAPIVAGNEVNAAQLGRKDVVTGADGKKVPVQYAVIEAADVIPSHNADGTKVPAYVDSNVQGLRAITNGRVAGLQAAYIQGTAQDYKNSLMSDDLHGIDKATIEGMQNPMLVRVMPMDQVNKNIGDVSNTAAGLSFNVVEQAKNDTNRVDLSKVQFNESGDVSPNTVRDFIKGMPDTERGNLIDKDGNPTKQAVERLNAAIFQQAYNNDKLTELGYQAQDEEARNIIRGLNVAAAKAIRLGEAGDYDVRPLVNEAVEMAINARRNNLSLQDAAKQVDITTNPIANQIVQMFADNPRSAKAIGENLSNLFDNAYTEASKTGEDMFGAVPKRSIEQLVGESFAKEKAPDLLEEPKVEEKEPKEFDISKSEYEIHQEIKNLDSVGLTKWLVTNAKNSAAKYIAEKLQQQITKFEKAGVKVKIIMLNGKSRHKGGVQGTSGVRGFGPGEKVYFEVKLNGLNAKGKADDSTVGYQIIMHELLHTVSQMQLWLIEKNYAKDYQVIQKDLADILKAVKKHNREEAKKNIVDQHAASYQKRFYKNTREIFAYGLSNATLQDYLSTIKVGDKTAYTKLVEIVRKLLGMDVKYDTALDKLMRVGDRVFQMSTDEISEIAKEHGWKFGDGKFTNSAGTNINELPEITSEGGLRGIPDAVKRLITRKPKEVVTEPVTEKAPAVGRNYLGQPVKPTWQFPEDTFIHVPGVTDVSINDLIYKFQDKQIDTKRAQDAISKAAGVITDDINVYEKEQLFHGKVATAIREYLLNELLPAIKKLKELNLKPKEMQDYLLARHAEERNNKMNELNKLDPRTGEERTTPWELQDRASGMSTADARAFLKGLDPAKKKSLETVAKMFDDMVTGTQKILVDSGADSQDTIDAWNDTYQHYVPLFRIEEDFINGMGASGLSKGFNVSGNFSKRAMGSEKEVQDIIANLIKQRERALIRAEKLTVTKALYGLFLMNPNPDVALPVNPDAIKSKDALIKELESLGYDNPAEIANNLMEEPKSRYISKEKRVIDKNTGLPTTETPESVKLKVDNLARFGDNVLTLRIDGKNRYIFFNQKNPDAVRMANSLRSLDVESLGTLTSLVSKATRWFASVNTQYNPIFAAVNLIRDVGGAQFNLTTTPLAGKQAQVTAGIFPAMKGIFKVLRAERKGEVGGDSDMEKAFRDFRKEGGQTGYRDSLARRENEQSIVDEQLKKITAGGNAKKAFKAVFGALSDFNDTLENAIRLSAYLAASKPKDKGGLGLSKQQSAIIAKNLTVNFDKKGQLSANINALYAFFNASIQGTARLAQTLKGPKGKAIIGGGVLLGSMQAVLLAAAGFKDDEPPEFVKERNFIIPTPGGGYISIPYPLGLHILPSVGRLTTEFMLTGGKNPTKKVGDLIGVFADGLSPVGSAGALQTIAPTVLDPLAALKENKDAFGRPIYKKEQATNPTPGYMRSRESSSEISKQISYFLNMASGGGKYSKGLVSPTADEIDYVVGQVTGGVGRELMKTGQTLKAAGTGEDLPAYRIPLAGRFYGETQSNAAESQRFYNNVIKMADHENEIKGRIKNKEPVGPYLKEHPEARLWQMANTTENQINALNKQKKEFIEKDLPKERIKRIENQKAVIMKRFNDYLAKIEK